MISVLEKFKWYQWKTVLLNLALSNLKHTRETVNLYAAGVLQKINLTCLGGPVDMYKQTRGG